MADSANKSLDRPCPDYLSYAYRGKLSAENWKREKQCLFSKFCQNSVQGERGQLFLLEHSLQLCAVLKIASSYKPRANFSEIALHFPGIASFSLHGGVFLNILPACISSSYKVHELKLSSVTESSEDHSHSRIGLANSREKLNFHSRDYEVPIPGFPGIPGNSKTIHIFTKKTNN